MIPDEDLGPAWLREYHHTDFGEIAADILAMEDFAGRLKADVERNYAPRALAVSDTMMASLPEADERFSELLAFLSALDTAQQATQQNVYRYINGTYGFATAADEVGKMYRDSDAWARARVTDVEAGFRAAGLPASTAETPDA